MFGENLRALRKSQDLSQEAYAHLLDRNRTYIGSIERGERNLRLRTVERLADLVGAEPLQLLTEKVVTEPAAALAPPMPSPRKAHRGRGAG